jgi:ferredoxin-NADP reductase
MEIRALEKKTALTASDKPAAIQTVELLQRRRLARNVFEIELSRPPSLVFEPGQTIRFIHESLERYYSLISAPDDSNLAICVYNVPQGDFSTVLANTEIGTHFTVSGPHGYFTFNRSGRTPVFVASGTGIAPFVSMGRSGITDFILLHEVERAEDLYYQEFFRKTASGYIPCLLAPPAADPLPPGTLKGKAANYIRKNLAPASYDFYLCGEREMTREVTLLADEYFPGSYVYKEVYF